MNEIQAFALSAAKTYRHENPSALAAMCCNDLAAKWAAIPRETWREAVIAAYHLGDVPEAQLIACGL